MRFYKNSELSWKGDRLYLGRRKLTEIVQDAKYSAMWRVRKVDGTLTDMVNITRARDAARKLALHILNGKEATP